MKRNKDSLESCFKIPRHMAFVWIQGFINGKTGTAALNSEKAVESGYIQMLQKKFEEYAAGQIRTLDQKLHALSAEAEKLIFELNKTPKPSWESKPVPADATAIELRAAARQAAELSAEKSAFAFRQKEILDRLVDIRTAFSELETSCQESLLKTAAEAEAVLAAYCKGVMHRHPLTEANIPKVNIDGAVRQFHYNVMWTAACLEHIDGEVTENHENR